MKISKLLNKNYFSILFAIILGFNCFADDKPVDIWDIEKKETDKISNKNSTLDSDSNQTLKNFESNIYDMQSKKKIMIFNLRKPLKQNI